MVTFALLGTFDNAKICIPTHMFEGQCASMLSEGKDAIKHYACTILNHTTQKKNEHSGMSMLPSLTRPSLWKQKKYHLLGCVKTSFIGKKEGEWNRMAELDPWSIASWMCEWGALQLTHQCLHQQAHTCKTSSQCLYCFPFSFGSLGCKTCNYHC